MRFLVVPSLLAAVVAIAACSGDDETTTVTVERTVTETTSGTVPSELPDVLTLYFLRGGKVTPVSRGVVSGPDLVEIALRQLLDGPSAADNGVRTAIPEDAEPGAVEVAGTTVIVGVTPKLGRAARAQVVYTLTALPNVRRVSFGGATPVGRRAFERQTPAILVESPLPGDQVAPGFEVTGTANTFEATFNYELKDSSGKVLQKNFVTATSGSGTRGTFRFDVQYEVGVPQEGRLEVFELSAEDGSRINESVIPLQLE